MWEYNYNYSDELYHYGVKGMKWGHRKAQRFETKAGRARESAKEWQEIGRHKASKYEAKGNTKKADKIKMKYDLKAAQDRADAKSYERRAKAKTAEAKFQQNQAKAGAARSRGAKLATNILAGPFANRTYNSVIAAGGTKTGARVVTGLVSMGGPAAHIVAGYAYTKMAGEKKTAKNY